LFLQNDGTLGDTPDPESDNPKNGFAISASGLFSCDNAWIRGTIVANGGLIGGWKINKYNIIKDWHENSTNTHYWV